MGFQIEAYRSFMDAHTRLNQYIKVSTAAIDYLSNSETNSGKLSVLINDLILKTGERWTPRILNDPKNELSLIKNDLTKSAIVWVYSAFDVFYKQVEGVLSTYFESSLNVSNQDNEEDKEHKVIELYKKLNWETEVINEVVVILRFYEAIRHSTAHNLGKPSSKLITISNSKDFNDAIANWKTKFKKRVISMPPLISETQIELKPHHSIMYSETCRRIVEDINNKLFLKMGIKYFVEKTLKKHLLDVNKLSNPQCTNLERYLVYHLKADYNLYILN